MRGVPRRYIVVAVALVIVAAGLTAMAVLDRRDEEERVTAGLPWRPSGLAVDSRTAIGAAADAGSPPRAVGPLASATSDAVWAADEAGSRVVRIDPRDGAVVRAVKTPVRPRGIAATPAAIWVSGAGAELVLRVDPATGFVTTVRVDAPAGPAIVAGDDGVWLASPPAGLLHLDPASGVSRRIDVGIRVEALALAPGNVWAIGPEGRAVLVDPGTGEIAGELRLGAGTYRLAAGGGGVWATDLQDGDVHRLALDLSVALDATRVGGAPVAITFAAGAVWAVDRDGRRLIAIDPASGRVLATVRTGSRPVAITGGPAAIWVVDETRAVLRVRL